MQKAKVNVLVALFCYSGNGGVRMVAHELVGWWGSVYARMFADERVGAISMVHPGDVPLTMERNRVVKVAKQGGYDIVWMIDNDNIPDLYASVGGKPFWESSFDFVYERLIRDIPSVVLAPYCGPPPHPVHGGMENVYVFRWESSDNRHNQQHFKVEAFSRQEAAILRGIQPVAAGPTGCSMYSTSAFDLLPIRAQTKSQILDEYAGGKIDQETALRQLAMESWYWYEFTDQQQTQKASTEDVTNTREIALIGYAKHKQEIVFCNWDSWAGHCKPLVVGKPEPIYTEQISEQYVEAIKNNLSITEKIREVKFDVSEVVSEQMPVQPPVSTPSPIRRARNVLGRSVVSVGPSSSDNELQCLADIVKALMQQNKGKHLRVVELGSWVGESAVAVKQALGENGTVFCVDHFGGDAVGPFSVSEVHRIGADVLRDAFKRNTESLGILLRDDTAQNAAAALPTDEGVDLLIVDVCPNDTAQVLDAWDRHVGASGWVVGLRYENPIVRVAVDDFFHSVRTFEDSRNSLWLALPGVTAS